MELLPPPCIGEAHTYLRCSFKCSALMWAKANAIQMATDTSTTSRSCSALWWVEAMLYQREVNTSSEHELAVPFCGPRLVQQSCLIKHRNLRLACSTLLVGAGQCNMEQELSRLSRICSALKWAEANATLPQYDLRAACANLQCPVVDGAMENIRFPTTS
jgi:hypothetical protein